MNALHAYDTSTLTQLTATPATDRTTAADRQGTAPPPLGTIRRPRHAHTVEKQRLARLAREQNAVQAIGALPEPGEEVVLLLDGTFHGWDILGALIELAACPVVRLEVATLGFNRTQADHLGDLIDDGTVRSARFVVSEMFAQKSGAEYGHLAQVLESRGHVCAATRNHAKLLLIELADGRTISAHGSLNLRRCNSFEQVAISADESLHAFFTDFLDDVVAGTFTP